MIFYKIIVKKYLTFMYERYIMIKSLAGVAELADALDLGSSAARRGGSSPLSCTNTKNQWIYPLVFLFYVI